MRGRGHEKMSAPFAFADRELVRWRGKGLKAGALKNQVGGRGLGAVMVRVSVTTFSTWRV